MDIGASFYNFKMYQHVNKKAPIDIEAVYLTKL